MLSPATIESLSTDGRGVVRVEGMVYFVPRGLPGDKVLLRLNPETNPPSAEIVERVEPSSLRISHPCPHAAECQGSLWGNLDYSSQLKYKQELVERTLRKAVKGITVLPTVASPLPWRYRNRISLHVWQQDHRQQVGYRTEARQETGVPIRTCFLPTEPISECLTSLASSLQTLDPDSITSPRRIQIHQTSAGAGIFLFFSEPLSADLVRFWSDCLRPFTPGGIFFAEATAAGVLRFNRPVLHSENALQMQTEWLGHLVSVHPAAFSQANSGAANLVGQRLIRFAAENQFSKAYDLYGGFGSLGLAVAGSKHPLTVFELSRLSEKTFTELSAKVQNKQTRFVQGDLLKTFPPHASGISKDDLIILDPPRSGSHPEILSAINRSKARHLIYLSCNPARLARDMSLLEQGGFQPFEIQPYDFFPQTPSIEVLTLFRRS